MKPFQLLLSIILVVVCLSVVVWIGRFKGLAPTVAESTQPKPAATPEDLPLPKNGPFGKAEIDETTFNFGIRLVHSKDEHVFMIKNAGQGKLDFKLGKPSCQCTGVEASKVGGGAVEDGEGSLAPGEAVNVLVKWKMETRMETFRHGLKVFTTDPDNRAIDLYVQGKVNTAFFLRPEGIWDLGELSPSTPSTAEGKILSPIFDDFVVEEEPRENSQVKVTFSPMDEKALEPLESKSGYSVHVEVGPNVPVGILREAVKLKVSKDDEQQQMEFYVVAKRPGPLEIRGVSSGAKFNSTLNKLVLGEFPAAQGKSASMTMFVKGFDKDLELLGVEPADTQIKAKLVEGKMLGKSRSYQLEISIPPGQASTHMGENAEIITLKFNLPDAPEFRMVVDYNSLR